MPAQNYSHQSKCEPLIFTDYWLLSPAVERKEDCIVIMERPKRKNPKVFGSEYMTHHLDVMGLVNHPLQLTVEELREMRFTEIKDLTMICGSGRTAGQADSYRGVLLTTVLDRADVIMREHESPSWMYVTITSSDGHWALFSYQELFNASIGEQAIVILERNGKPLGEHEGEIAFISANDKLPGPRKMRYLQRVEVHEHIPSPEMPLQIHPDQFHEGTRTA
jgi:DMSO/TMAO reductase YedYZ molybdopterin-dependent catalytic subunit